MGSHATYRHLIFVLVILMATTGRIAAQENEPTPSPMPEGTVGAPPTDAPPPPALGSPPRAEVPDGLPVIEPTPEPNAVEGQAALLHETEGNAPYVIESASSGKKVEATYRMQLESVERFCGQGCLLQN